MIYKHIILQSVPKCYLQTSNIIFLHFIGDATKLMDREFGKSKSKNLKYFIENLLIGYLYFISKFMQMFGLVFG